MKYLITGGCGFIGSNLAAEVLKRGEELFVLDNLFRYGSGSNLEWLRTKGDFTYYPYDTRNTNDVETVIKEVQPDYIFHLAGQVAMTTSISIPGWTTKQTLWGHSIYWMLSVSILRIL